MAAEAFATSSTVRIFSALSEIENEPGFAPDNPIDASNYREIIGEYNPLDQQIRCCVRNPSGRLCYELHGNGFVARLSDGSVTVIGHTCAENKFGADSKLSLDRRAHERRKAQQKKLGRLVDLLDMGRQIEDELAAADVAVAAVACALAEAKTEFGAEVLAILAKRARGGGTAVTVTGISVKRYKDEDGAPREELQYTQHRVGNLAGIDAFRPGALNAIRETIRRSRSAISEAATTADSRKRVSPATIDRLVATLADYPRAGIEAAELQSAYRRFLNNDFSVLCYLTSERSTRYRVAQIVLQTRGQSASRSDAKAFIAALDARHKAAFNVARFQF